MGKLDWRKRACAAVLLCATAPIGVSAQTFKTLHRFDGTDGANPQAGLVQATGGNLYGTTENGGANSAGTVFKISPNGGPVKTVYSFCSQGGCADGSLPYAGLVQGTGGNFYGTTQYGGANQTGSCKDGPCGTVFKTTPGGTLTTLYSFCSQGGCTDGELPYAGLVQGTGGNFYGTTYGGGANHGGTVFKITPSGTLTTLYSFCSQGGGFCTDGAATSAGLVQATGGNLYGTTPVGGANHNYGTVFKITPSGTLTTLYSFCSQGGTSCTDGAYPLAELVQATDGNLYGTAWGGGANNYGTVFKITPSGTLTTLYSFCSQTGCTDGGEPSAGLVQATDGNFYGTTLYGGANTGACGVPGCGTVFKITPSGTLTTLYSFCPEGRVCKDGRNPSAGLVQDTNGMLYGTTGSGGAKTRACRGYCGTVFSLSVGLGRL
jgi:uncharacterized repeat protein (TIGR03803 family)